MVQDEVVFLLGRYLDSLDMYLIYLDLLDSNELLSLLGDNTLLHGDTALREPNPD